MPVRHNPDAPPRVLLHPSQEHPDLGDVLAVHNFVDPRSWGGANNGVAKGMAGIVAAERPTSRQRVTSAVTRMVDAIAKKRGLLVSTTDDRPISGQRPRLVRMIMMRTRKERRWSSRLTLGACHSTCGSSLFACLSMCRTPCPITPMNFLFGPPGSPGSPGSKIDHSTSPPVGSPKPYGPSYPKGSDGSVPDQAAASTAPELAAEALADAKEDKQPLTLDLSKLSKIRGGVKLRRDLKVIPHPS